MKVVRDFRHGPVRYWQMGFNPFGPPKMHVYAYLLDGCLIDTGMTWVRKELGSALSGLAVSRIALTHHHEDHSGNAAYLSDFKSCKIYGSELCRQILQAPPRVEPARWLTWGQNKAVDITAFDDEASFTSEKYRFDIIPIPGHALDQVGYYVKKEGWFFSGDLYVHDRINIFMKDECIYQQIDSIQDILALDFDILFCGHRPILKGAKQHLVNKLNYLSEFRDSVISLDHEGRSISEIMSVLGMKEKRMIKALSLGQLSTSNMIKSVLRKGSHLT